MAARKLAQEIEKCFKKVAEGVAEFESIYEKIEQAGNQSQKEKLEDQLKREIKKLQRLRDQIKSWAASNEIKDKAPLLEHRKLIETQMERFKAVEKAMKTKAYSKEGLSAAAKLDPREQAKLEATEFLAEMVDQLEEQIEKLETESEQLQATMKKGKGHSAKADRIAAIERTIERHKWHQGKLELIRRSLDNGGVDADQVQEVQEDIKYYVMESTSEDFVENEEMYDDLNLDEEEDAYGMNQDNDKGSSQDTQSVAEDAGAPTEQVEGKTAGVPVAAGAKARTAAVAEAAAATSGRRPSAQLKSPLPALATLHAPLPSSANSGTTTTTGALPMKPASLPARPAEGLKYASAAAAAAASDRGGVGIAPLPPPPGMAPVGGVGISPLPPAQARTSATSATSSPATSSIQPATARETPQPEAKPQLAQPSFAPETKSTAPAAVASNPFTASSSQTSKAESKSRAAAKAPAVSEPVEPSSTAPPRTNGVTNGIKTVEEEPEEESIYHLPSSLQDLVESYEASRKRPPPAANSPATTRMLEVSQSQAPDRADSEPRRRYQPDSRLPPLAMSASLFPQEPLSIFDDPRLYARIDPDTLFYVFYYKQGTDQQYLAAKALKDQSWRFHKQYQTWFQRHEEPKSITEEFEQGTYRFFDYESTWMNRRKADFKFAYKFLEDDI